jgi:hypothetical protein
MDNSTKADLLGLWMLVFTIFVTRKFQQPIKVKNLSHWQQSRYPASCFEPDLTISLFFLTNQGAIRDKPVFMFNVLLEEEKKAWIQKPERQKGQELFE